MTQITNIGGAYSKAARRRRRKATGGKRAMEAAQEIAERAVRVTERDDPLSVVMQARARRICRPVTSDNLAPILGEDAGIALCLGAGDEASRLWDVFKRYDAAMRTYSRLVLGRDRFPSVSKMEFLPERLETRADDVIDTRSHDERIRDARNGRAAWAAMIDKLYPWQRMIIDGAARQIEVLHRDGELTSSGRSFVAAMRRLADVESDGRNR